MGQRPLKGVRIEGNYIDWQPPIAAPVVSNHAEFLDGPALFAGNTIRSSVQQMVNRSEGLVMERNVVESRRSKEKPRPKAFRLPSIEDLNLTSPWLLVAVAGDSRAQVTLLESLQRQFRSSGLQVILFADHAPNDEQARNLRYDWNLTDIVLAFTAESTVEPRLAVLDSRRRVVWSYEGLVSPGILGRAIRSFFGDPDYGQLVLK